MPKLVFDVADYERRMREDHAKHVAECQKMIERGEMDPEFYKAQSLFDEVNIQFALACAHAMNECSRENAVGAMGTIIGAMFGAAASSMTGEERQVASAWIERSYIQARNASVGKDTDGVHGGLTVAEGRPTHG